MEAIKLILIDRYKLDTAFNASTLEYGHTGFLQNKQWKRVFHCFYLFFFVVDKAKLAGWWPFGGPRATCK